VAATMWARSLASLTGSTRENGKSKEGRALDLTTRPHDHKKKKISDTRRHDDLLFAQNFLAEAVVLSLSKDLSSSDRSLLANVKYALNSLSIPRGLGETFTVKKPTTDKGPDFKGKSSRV